MIVASLHRALARSMTFGAVPSPSIPGVAWSEAKSKAMASLGVILSAARLVIRSTTPIYFCLGGAPLLGFWRE